MKIKSTLPVTLVTVFAVLGLPSLASASVPPIGAYTCFAQFQGHGTLKVKPDHRYRWIRDVGPDQTGGGKIRPKDGRRFVFRNGPLGPQPYEHAFKGNWSYINGTDHVVGISMSRGETSGAQYTCEEN
jgi:hypothetical protein